MVHMGGHGGESICACRHSITVGGDDIVLCRDRLRGFAIEQLYALQSHLSGLSVPAIGDVQRYIERQEVWTN